MIGHLNEIVEGDWHPVSRWALGAWLVFYGWFLIYGFTQGHGFLFIDSANLVVHEGGHLLFGWLGPTLGLWGGTILQWLVPLLLAAYFFVQRQTTAFAFCMFFFFENWLYTASYMADARCSTTPESPGRYDCWAGAACSQPCCGWCGKASLVKRGSPESGDCKFDHLLGKCYKD